MKIRLPRDVETQVLAALLRYRMAERPHGVGTPELFAGAMARESRLAKDTLRRLFTLMNLERED